MPSGKEAHHGRAGYRKVRQLSVPERVNTARPDEEYCNIALQQINALDELPTSEAELAFTDSPTVQRLQHKAYELSEGPGADQQHIPLLERPTSSGSLPKDECFTFEARQHREINFRREKQPPIQRESLSQQRGQSTENADENLGVALDKKHDPSFAENSNSIMEIPKDFDATIRIDLTRMSPSVAVQTIQPSNTTKVTEPTQIVCQEPSGNVTHEPGSENLVKSAVNGSAVYHSEALGVKAQSHTNFHHMPIGNSGNLQSHKHNRDFHHPVHLANVSRLASDSIHQLTAHPESNFSPVTVKEIHLSDKGMQDCHAQADGPHITPEAPRDANHDASSTVAREELKNLAETLIPCSKQGDNKGLTGETQGSQLPHTPQANARLLAEKPKKVCKVLSKPRLVGQQAGPGSQRTTDLPNITAITGGPVSASRNTTPSEEDLFYLLMHRQRQRKDIETKLLVRQKHLETVNARLSQRNQSYQHQLSASRVDRDKSATEASVQKVALEDLKTRFQKLKTFVNGLGNDYSALRQQADQMKLSQQDLLHEKEDIFQDLENCRTASAASERSINTIVSNIAKFRQNVAPLEQSLLEATETLEGERRLLSKEQQKNKRLEKYLLQVAKTQNRYSSAIQDEQKAVLKQLKEITTKINAVEKATTAEPQPLLLPGLDECVRMLTTLHDADRVRPADITKVADALKNLSQSFSSYRKSSDEGFQAAADAQINFGNQLVAQITTLLEMLHATTIQEGHLAALREDKVRLEEQLKSSENMRREIRDGRTSADTRESHLRSTTDSLLNQLKTLQSQAIPVHKPSPQMDERDMIGTWRLKYTDISQQLASSEERVSIREKEIRQSEGKVRELTEKLEEAQAERNAAIQDLNEAKVRDCAQEGEIGKLQQKLAGRENTLEVLRLEIQSAEVKIREEREKVEELAGLNTTHQKELEEVKSQLEKDIEERAKANQQVRELKHSLTGFAEAQQEAAKVVQLTEELHKEHTKVTKLIQEIEPLEEIARQVPRLKQQSLGKQNAIELLEARLKEAEAASRQVETMKRNASKSADDISTLQGELRSAQKEASWVAEQKEEFRKTEKEVEELRKKLVNLQPLADQVPGLQKEAKDRSEEAVRLQRELGTAKESVEQLQDFQVANRRSGEEITLLKREMHAATERLKRLQSVEDASDKKDQEMRILNERIRATEDSLSRFQGLDEAVREKDKRIVTLNQELDVTKDSLKHLKDVQGADGLKDQEIQSLQERLRATESILTEIQVAKEESQRKEIELLALKDRLAKVEEESQRLSQILAERPSQDQELSQGMTALSQEVMTGDDKGSQAESAIIRPPALNAVPQLRRRASRNVSFVDPQALQIRVAETVRVESGGMANPTSNQDFETPDANNLVQMTGSEILQTQETTFVPESQPALDSWYEKTPVSPQSFSSTSSPLTNLSHFVETPYETRHESAYFGHKKAAEKSSATFTKIPVNFKSSHQLPLESQRDQPSSRPPSSSTGDTMLLEAEEELKRVGQHHTNSLRQSSKQRLGSQSGSGSPDGPPTRKTDGIFRNGAGKLSSKTAKVNDKGTFCASSKHPSPRRLRSESQTRLKKTIPLQERAPSLQNIPTSPPGSMLREKYLPNSAAKRRLEDDEISLPSSSQDGSKRLKRDLSALEVKTPSKKKGSSFLEEATPATGTGRLNHPSMPTGGRKGSIIGTNASAPGAGQYTIKKSKKTLKTDRYSVRFNQDTT